MSYEIAALFVAANGCCYTSPIQGFAPRNCTNRQVKDELRTIPRF